MFSRFNAIVANTFVETIRQPIFGILLWAAAGLLVVNPSIALFSLQSGNDNKIMQDVGLATLLLFGLLASAFSATGVITREIENRTVLTVVSKPVGRPTFVLAKYVGVCTALLIGYYFLCLVFLMTVRHGVLESVSDPYDQPVLVFSLIALGVSLIAATFGNYVYGWHFPTTLLAWVIPLGTLAFGCVLFFSKKWEVQSPLASFSNAQIMYAIAILFCSVLVLTAFAVVISTRFTQVMTLVFCAGIFVLGLLSDHLIGTRLEQQQLNTAGQAIYQSLYAIVPNFQYFWVADALTQWDPELQAPPITVAYLSRIFGYTALYVPAVLGLGVVLFQTREVG